MPTNQEIDAEIAKRQEAQSLNSAVDAEIAKRLQTGDKGVIQQFDDVIQKIPGVPALSEFAAGVNRSVLGALDFLGPDSINALLNVTGFDARVPGFEESLGSAGGFMEPGLARDIVSTAGEVVPAALGGGALIRQTAKGLQALGPAAEVTQGALPSALRQAASTTAGSDVALGAVSGGGEALGESIGGPAGALVGSILAPIAGQGITSGLKGIMEIGGQGISTLMKSVGRMSDDGAAELISQAMVREGVSPDEVLARLAQLGPEAIPADMGINFSRLLRLASNKVPRIEGQAADKFRLRQAGQSDRIIDALDDAGGTSSLSVGDEIERLNTLLNPRIKELYSQVREGAIKGGLTPVSGPGVTPTRIGDAPSRLPVSIRGILEGDNSASRAARIARRSLKDKSALGESVGDIDLIDETKKVMDDQIGKALRLGEKNKAMNMVRLKNVLVSEADTSIPVYKEARDLFAGKAQLENAADAGEMFFKMNAREMREFTSTYGSSEQKLFKLGAKQAILDKVDELQTNANAVKRLFGRNGDVKKLRMLFDDEAAFDRFSESLEREAQFVMTRRAAQANSTTAQQLADQGNAAQALGEAFSLLGNPVQSASAFGRILQGLSGKKADAVFTESLEKAGDILLESGMNPDRLRAMLRAGNPNTIEAALRKVMISPIKRITPASIAGGVDASLDDQK